jgi:glycosyltransferase involved in cell wall biosynthesis
VSVMMPAFNAEPFVAAAMRSVVAQELGDWELVVVNDGSTDGTADAVRSVGDSRIRLVEQPNRGEAASRNVALGLARGEYLAFLDADDEYLPGHLQESVRFLEEHPGCSAVYSDGHYIAADARPLATLSSRRQPPRNGWVFDAVIRSSDFLCPPVCVVLRMEPIVAHRLRFDEGITIGPDWDFFAQFANVASVGHLDRITCCYRLHGSNLTIKTGTAKRRQDLARCRTNAIGMTGFERCPAEVRVAVFYDLLVNALDGLTDCQQQAADSPQFARLPPRDQSRLLRLMAARAIIAGDENRVAAEWLRRARALDPHDVRGAFVDRLFTLSPGACRAVLRVRTLRQRRREAREQPYGDLL